MPLQTCWMILPCLMIKHYIIELGNKLTPLSAEEHNEQNKVPGCVSQV